jgi:serine/threonine protein kinase
MSSIGGKALDISEGELARGTIVGGRYVIRNLLGIGTFGQVYQASDSANNDVMVALKRFKVSSSLEPEEAAEIRSLFWREAKLQLRLQHRNVVRILGIISEANSDELYIISEYVAGGNLRRLINSKPKMTITEAVRILAPIADALSYSHQKRIIHRDIKPENILLKKGKGKGVWPLLTDFGLARHLAPSEMTSTHLGSPAYMAPEQFYGEYDFRTDIYSIGVIFYELISGMRPFKGGVSSLMRAHIYHEPPGISDISENVSECLKKFMAKEPEKRHDTMEGAYQALLDLAELDEENLNEEPEQVNSSIIWKKSPKKNEIEWEPRSWAWETTIDLPVTDKGLHLSPYDGSWLIDDGERHSRLSIVDGSQLSEFFANNQTHGLCCVAPRSTALAVVSKDRVCLHHPGGHHAIYPLGDHAIEGEIHTAALLRNADRLLVSSSSGTTLIELRDDDAIVFTSSARNYRVVFGLSEPIHQKSFQPQ